jgi:hypothetical protein
MDQPVSAQTTSQEAVQSAAAPASPQKAPTKGSPDVGNDSSGVGHLSIRSEDGQGEDEDDGSDGPPIKRRRLESQDPISQDQPLDDDDPVLALANANNGNGASDQYPPE